jgi:hypothetical protein
MKCPYRIDNFINKGITYHGLSISELSDLPQKYQKMVCEALNEAHTNGQRNLQDELKQLLDIREYDADR